MKGEEEKAAPSSFLSLVVRILLALGLLGGLFYAGYRIYQRLPANSSSTSSDYNAPLSGTRVVVRNTIRNATLRSPVELYHFDLPAVRREFDESPRLAKQFDDFLARRMHDVLPVKAEVTNDGVASTLLSQGDWWLRAVAQLDTGEEIEWRLPLRISARDQAIDLSYENSYERTKKF
jgi:CRP-like cAMP-binding protein